MKIYEVVLSPEAREDINDSLQWLSEHAPEKMEEWFAALELSIHSLAELPERCNLAPENGKWGDEELRQLLFTDYPSKYRIIFTIADDEVRILHIRHGARLYLYQRKEDYQD